MSHNTDKTVHFDDSKEGSVESSSKEARARLLEDLARPVSLPEQADRSSVKLPNLEINMGGAKPFIGPGENNHDPRDFPRREPTEEEKKWLDVLTKGMKNQEDNLAVNTIAYQVEKSGDFGDYDHRAMIEDMFRDAQKNGTLDDLVKNLNKRFEESGSDLRFNLEENDIRQVDHSGCFPVPFGPVLEKKYDITLSNKNTPFKIIDGTRIRVEVPPAGSNKEVE